MKEKETKFCRDCFWALPENVAKIIENDLGINATNQEILKNKLYRVCPGLKFVHKITVGRNAKCVNEKAYRNLV